MLASTMEQQHRLFDSKSGGQLDGTELLRLMRELDTLTQNSTSEGELATEELQGGRSEPRLPQLRIPSTKATRADSRESDLKTWSWLMQQGISQQTLESADFRSEVFASKPATEQLELLKNLQQGKARL